MLNLSENWGWKIPVVGILISSWITKHINSGLVGKIWQVRFYLALHQWFAVKASAASTVGYMHDASEAVCDFCRTAMEYFCRRWTSRKSFYKFCLTVVVIVSLGGIIFTQNNSFTKLRYALFTNYRFVSPTLGNVHCRNKIESSGESW